MKRILAILLALVFIVCLVGCGDINTGSDGISGTDSSNSSETVSENDDTKIKFETKVVAGYDYYMVIKDGKWWMFGDHGYAQAGRSGKSSSSPMMVKGAYDFIDVKTENYASAARTASGDLWTVGYNEYGQLGNGTTNVYEPTKVLSKVTSYAIAGREMAAVTENGELYAWGQHFGTSPQVILSNVAYVTSSENGGGAFGAVTNSGDFYYWGYNDQLGSLNEYIDTNDKNEFIYPVKILGNVAQVFWGHGGTASGAVAALTNNGELYACGIYAAKYYAEQLGMQKIMENVKDVSINSNEDVGDYLLALTNDDSLYIYGRLFSYFDEDGVLIEGGSGNNYNGDAVPVKVMDNVKNFHAGVANCFAITKDDILYAWGLNEHGECSVGNDQPVYKPVKILENIIYITTSSYGNGTKDIYNEVGAITADGSLYTWGTLRNNKLGFASDEDYISTPYIILKDVEYVTFGTSNSKCAAAITKDDEIFIWGQFSNRVYSECEEPAVLPIKIILEQN